MQWSSERNAGFSRGNPQSLFLPVVTDPEFHYAAINVEAQIDNPHSLLSWTKRVVALRKRHRAFGRGSLTFLDHGNEKVLAFLRVFEGETLMVVANLSRYVQPVTLDLSAFAGMRPVELFGQGRGEYVSRQERRRRDLTKGGGWHDGRGLGFDPPGLGVSIERYVASARRLARDEGRDVDVRHPGRVDDVRSVGTRRALGDRGLVGEPGEGARGTRAVHHRPVAGLSRSFESIA